MDCCRVHPESLFPPHPSPPNYTHTHTSDRGSYPPLAWTLSTEQLWAQREALATCILWRGDRDTNPTLKLVIDTATFSFFHSKDFSNLFLRFTLCLGRRCGMEQNKSNFFPLQWVLKLIHIYRRSRTGREKCFLLFPWPPQGPMQNVNNVWAYLWALLQGPTTVQCSLEWKWYVQTKRGAQAAHSAASFHLRIANECCLLTWSLQAVSQCLQSVLYWQQASSRKLGVLIAEDDAW